MPLLQMTKMQAMLSLAAVHSPWMVIRALPSPIIPNTGRSGLATCTPIVVPMPPPMDWPRKARRSPRFWPWK